MDKMTPEYKVTREKIKAVINESGLPEMQMYALLSTCMTEVAHKHNGNEQIRLRAQTRLVELQKEFDNL